MGKFYDFFYGYHSKQVQKVWPIERIRLEQLFVSFWKKLIFHFSDSTFLIKKKKMLKSEKK